MSNTGVQRDSLTLVSPTAFLSQSPPGALTSSWSEVWYVSGRFILWAGVFTRVSLVDCKWLNFADSDVLSWIQRLQRNQTVALRHSEGFVISLLVPLGHMDAT